MKKLLLTISAALLLVIGVKAQSMDMETWVNDPIGSLQDPQGWASFNPASAAGMSQTVFKITSPAADVNQGLASAKIVTQKASALVTVPNPFRPMHNFDTVGILSLGSLVGTTLKFGQPIATRPAMLSFASKYTPVNGDSGFVVVFLTKWVGAGVRDTVARGIYRMGSATTTYSNNTINLAYNPLYAAVVPDTQMINCTSSKYRTPGAQIGSTLFVDNFQWSGYNSTDDINGEVATVTYFPNPASSEINFTSSKNASYVEVSDITGRKVGMYLMQNNKVKIQTESFTRGLYLYDVLNEKKEIINRGKFEIAK